MKKLALVAVLLIGGLVADMAGNFAEFGAQSGAQ